MCGGERRLRAAGWRLYFLGERQHKFILPVIKRVLEFQKVCVSTQIKLKKVKSSTQSCTIPFWIYSKMESYRSISCPRKTRNSFKIHGLYISESIEFGDRFIDCNLAVKTPQHKGCDEKQCDWPTHSLAGCWETNIALQKAPCPQPSPFRPLAFQLPRLKILDEKGPK